MSDTATPNDETGEAAPSAGGHRFSVVVLAAGKGTRMRSELPKVLHEAAGVPLLEHVIRAAESLGPRQIVVVVGHGSDQIRERFAARRQAGEIRFVMQRELLGTGHALLQAREALADEQDCVVVLNGDGPLVTAKTISALVEAQAGRPGMALATCEVSDPSGLGRIVRDRAGDVAGVVEDKDASADQLALREINPGIYAFDGSVFDLSTGLSDANAAGEYYITQLLELYLRAGRQVTAIEVEDELEILAVNDREELARADRALRDRTRRRWLLAGVTMIAPEQVFLDEDVQLGRDVVIWPGAHLLGATTVEDGAIIGPGAVLRDCNVRAGGSVPANLVATGQTF